MTKAQIVRRGHELGVDFSLTHSCYDPREGGASCGECDACLLRRAGFAEAGLADPVGVRHVKIAELFRSQQGEGLLTGTPSVFVRASGCNLRCWFCDTPYTSWQPEGVDLSVEEILERVNEYDTPHVVITGGEPMLWAELVPLSAALARQGRHITIETAGTLDLPVACDLMSISPKLANSTPSRPQSSRAGAFDTITAGMRRMLFAGCCATTSTS